LLISIGHAGHVTPLFELAKGLKNHNVTFLTQPLAQSYIDFNSYSNTSSFRIIYTNESSEALIYEKQKTQKLIFYSSNHSFFDSLSYTTELLSEDNSLLNKTIHILMTNQFDVIIMNSLVKIIHILCKQTNTPCIIQNTESFSNMFDFNLPNIYSLLSKEQMTEFKYRIYNVIYTLRLSIIFITKLLPSFNIMLQSLPKVPGPFYESFSITNLLFTQSKCLELFSISPTFYIPSYRNDYIKYLGAFIDETTIKSDENELTDWIKSKENNSIIYGAFGTSSLIQFNRMKNLINGLAEFLIKIPNSFLLLVLHGSNYQTYQLVLNEINNKKYLDIFMDNQRVKIVNKFVEQKWILQQKSIKLFLSHCGMGSCSEGIYYEKPILCMPFNMDQFINSISIVHLSIGLSLFIPPSLFQSLIHPYHFYDYTFSANNVTTKLLKIWENDNYQKMIKIMSIEMKHAGGLKRAVEEVEFFAHLKGNLDRYAPFQSTLPFYQRYMLDLITIFIILPMTILIYGFHKCRKRHRKEKND
jgi:UDP:flavonoid glycosyltransferase YjiC (YdhE family)